MAEHYFPNGFESWQKTHYEVVEVLTYFRNLEEDKQPRKFAEMLDRSGTDQLYKTAIELTDKFERQHPNGTGEQTLFEAIEEFFIEEKKSL